MIKSLSIIFPFYNEEARLQSSLKHILNFLKKKNKFKIELIFVDDGSSDNSYLIINNFIKKYNKYQSKKKIKMILIKSKTNLGKGSALKLGVKNSKNDWILTTDIDMSVSLFQLHEWINKKYITNKFIVYFGSRNHKRSIVKTLIYRKMIGHIFNFLIFLVLGINLRDTQCGYKLYKKKTAKFIFSKLKNHGFIHDIELVMLLKSKKINILELPLKWRHKNNSRLNVFSDSIKMFLGILLIKLRYTKN